MKTLYHTIQLSPDELELLGDGLIEMVKRDVVTYTSLEDFEFLNEETLELLQNMMDCGYVAHEWENVFDTVHRFSDAREWARHIIKIKSGKPKIKAK